VHTRVGYTGGTKKNPTYRTLGDHTEAIQIQFDPTVVTYEQLLDLFWNSHDPTRSCSTQYRSAIFYHNPIQQQAANKTLKQQLNSNKIKTSIESMKIFYEAEEYHQQFLAKQEMQNSK